MGVDISFHIEVRCKDKWRPLVWQTPMELKSYLYKEDEGKDWYTGHCCFWCRYYHFGDFLEDHATTGLPEDVSPEMKEELSGDDFQDEYWLFLRLLMAVRSFLDGVRVYVDGDKVRVLYAIC